MKTVVVGSGGREHALACALVKSREVEEVTVIPGNPGMALDEGIRTCDIPEEELASFCKENSVDLVVIGPEDPLCRGLGDELRKKGIRVFGPDAAFAQLEGSKAFAKDFMKKYGVATASYEVFQDYNSALSYIERQEFPLVIKASGLAAGKGVIICNDLYEGRNALISIMVDKEFQESGSTVVVEEYLEGRETSILSIYDGTTIFPLISSMDHKKIGENETGPNTGGMGAIAPSPYFTEEVSEDFRKNILEPTLKGLKAEGFSNSACIFFGLMITEKGVRLLEYNLRFGDPETQVVTSLLEGDLYEILFRAEEGALKGEGILTNDDLMFSQDTAITFVLAAKGYPGKYEKNLELDMEKDPELKIFYAGVKKDDKGRLRSSGGRILAVTGRGRKEDKKAIQDRIIGYLEKNRPQDTVFRRDIGNV